MASTLLMVAGNSLIRELFQTIFVSRDGDNDIVVGRCSNV